MIVRPTARAALVALALLAASAPARAVEPDDEHAIDVAYAVGEPISASELLRAWGRAFDALVLEVDLTISSFSGSGSVDLPPGTNSRSYTGEAITVADGAYVVFGGLESEREAEVEEKVPLLGDIPILGHLFKTWRRTRSRSRLYVFLRPTVFGPETFDAETRLAERLRARAQLESGREAWLPPLVSARDLRAGFTLQDEALEVFGTGSASPFGEAAASR